MPLTQLHTYTPRTPLGVLDEEIEAIIAAVNQNETDIAAHTHELSALDATGVTAGYVLEAQGDDTADWVPHAAPAHSHEIDELDATGITDGHVATADGAGGVAWEAPAGGAATIQKVIVTHSTTQTITTSAALVFDTDVTDGWSGHDTSTNNSRVYADSDGYYLVNLVVADANVGTSQRPVAHIDKNGGGTQYALWRYTGFSSTPIEGSMSGARIMYLSDGDYIEAVIAVASAWTIDGGENNLQLSVLKLGN